MTHLNWQKISVYSVGIPEACRTVTRNVKILPKESCSPIFTTSNGMLCSVSSGKLSSSDSACKVTESFHQWDLKVKNNCSLKLIYTHVAVPVVSTTALFVGIKNLYRYQTSQSCDFRLFKMYQCKAN